MENDFFKRPDDATAAFFGDRAKKTAERLIPVLTSELYYDLNRTPITIELVVMLTRKVQFEVLNFCLVVESIKHNSQLQDFLSGIEWVMGGPGYTPVVKSAYNTFKRELEDYKKKYKEDIRQTIAKAKEEGRKARKSIFRLVQWDKSWLQWNFIQKHIFIAQSFNDSDFFEQLSDAIRKKSCQRQSIKERNILSLVSFFSKRYDLSLDNGLKKIHDNFTDLGLFNESSKLMLDFKYFKKQLRRHRII